MFTSSNLFMMFTHVTVQWHRFMWEFDSNHYSFTPTTLWNLVGCKLTDEISYLASADHLVYPMKGFFKANFSK